MVGRLTVVQMTTPLNTGNHAIEYSSGLDPQRSTYLGRNGMHRADEMCTAPTR